MTDLYDCYLNSSDDVALQLLRDAYEAEGGNFDYIGKIPATYDADGAPKTFLPGYFANLRLSRELEPGELAAYLIAPPVTPFRVWAA